MENALSIYGEVRSRELRLAEECPLEKLPRDCETRPVVSDAKPDLPRSSAPAASDPVAAVREAADAAARVRPITYADVAWFMELGVRRYPARWDPVGTEFWLRNRVLANPVHHHAVRSDNAAVVTTLSATQWLPSDWDALVTTVMADEGAMWELLPLLRASVGWAKSKKCATWKVSSETKHDLGPLAKRVGAKTATYYLIDWRKEREQSWAKSDP